MADKLKGAGDGSVASPVPAPFTTFKQNSLFKTIVKAPSSPSPTGSPTLNVTPTCSGQGAKCGGCNSYSFADSGPNVMLLCDHCDFGGMHLGCLGLKAAPEGDWLCQSCVAKGFTVSQGSSSEGRKGGRVRKGGPRPPRPFPLAMELKLHMAKQNYMTKGRGARKGAAEVRWDDYPDTAHDDDLRAILAEEAARQNKRVVATMEKLTDPGELKEASMACSRDCRGKGCARCIYVGEGWKGCSNHRYTYKPGCLTCVPGTIIEGSTGKTVGVRVRKPKVTVARVPSSARKPALAAALPAPTTVAEAKAQAAAMAALAKAAAAKAALAMATLEALETEAAAAAAVKAATAMQ